jgi:hypothetical protein
MAYGVWRIGVWRMAHAHTRGGEVLSATAHQYNIQHTDIGMCIYQFTSSPVYLSTYTPMHLCTYAP